jgi:pyridinium-3,5-bisthiocarboxylic acid mononucleotide nickel chelatase
MNDVLPVSSIAAQISAPTRRSERELSVQGREETITVLETAVDDSTPEVLAHVAELALASGALDVVMTPVIMKKGRPGTLITLLCNEPEAAILQDLLLRETSTLGVRMRRERRTSLERSHVTVTTLYGNIRMKIGVRDGEELNAAPEFEDCRAAAQKYGVAVKQVMQAAIAAYAAMNITRALSYESLNSLTARPTGSSKMGMTRE